MIKIKNNKLRCKHRHKIIKNLISKKLNRYNIIILNVMLEPKLRLTISLLGLGVSLLLRLGHI